MSDFMRTLCKIAIPVCLQKEAKRPLTAEIWTRWAGVLCVYFPSTTESLISFSVSLRSRAPPSATVTCSS